MGIFDWIGGQFIDVIDWTDDSHDTMVYRFERQGNEIKYGAKLTVRDSQVAIFVNEGEIADVLGPGLYELETKNLPVLSSLQHWDHGFKSPFKAEVYFCNTKRFVDLKWGTKNPLMMRDAEFGAVRIRAFGTYGIRLQDATMFMREIVGTDGHFTTDEISDQLRNMISSRFASIIAGSNIPVLDMAANYDQVSDYISTRLKPEIAEYGLELVGLMVENISLPSEVEQALDKRTSMGVIGNLDQFMQFQTGVAVEKGAAAGGSAGEGIGMGVGLAMGQQMANSMSAKNQPNTPAAVTPPPLPNAKRLYHVEQNGTATGPYTVDAIEAMMAAGQIDAKSLVWTQGMANWQGAAEVSELAPMFSGSKPPPLPK